MFHFSLFQKNALSYPTLFCEQTKVPYHAACVLRPGANSSVGSIPFFAVTWSYVPGDELGVNDPFLSHLAAAQAVLALNVYIMSDRLSPSLNSDAVRNPGGAQRYAPFDVWPDHAVVPTIQQRSRDTSCSVKFIYTLL